MKLADLISLSRIPLGLLCAYFFISGNFMACLALQTLAVLTDFIDGRVASRLGPSKWGEKIDLISDVILEIVLIVVFSFYGNFPVYLAAIILARIIFQLARANANLSKLKNGTAMTWVAFFFFILATIGNESDQSLGEALNTIALPYIFYPVTAGLELMACYLIFGASKESPKG